jgi:uncharacterized lipoprotein YmbA
MAEVGDNMKRIMTLFLLGGLVAGCASTPGPSLYTLNMTPSAQAGSPVNIAVGRLRVAEALQNKRILIKKSPTEIEYYAAAQWAAGLDELLAEKLEAEFGPADATRPSVVLSGSLLAFEQVDSPVGGEAHVRFEVEIRDEGASHYSKPKLSKIYDVRMPVPAATAGGVVEALSGGLETVARAIVVDASAL